MSCGAERRQLYALVRQRLRRGEPLSSRAAFSLRFRQTSLLIIVKVLGAPSGEVLVRKFEQFIGTLGSSSLEAFNPLLQGRLVAIELDEDVPGKAWGPTDRAASRGLASYLTPSSLNDGQSQLGRAVNNESGFRRISLAPRD